MANYIEEKLINCKSCGKATKHHRNNNKSTGFMLLVHVLLTLCTFGVWFFLIASWKILFWKVGGWICSECEK